MKCVSEITIDENNCLPKCSGLQISSFVKDSFEKNKDLLQDMDTLNSMQLNILANVYGKLENWKKRLPVPLTSWSRYYLTEYKGSIFQLLEFSKNTKLQDLIENLSKKYWNYKGYFNLELKGNKIVKLCCIVN